MEGYAPTTTAVGLAVLGAAAAIAGFGFVLQRGGRAGRARAVAWTLAVGAFLVTERLLRGEGAGFRMLALIALVALALKAVVAVEARRQGRPPLAAGAWCAFVGGWPGMQPRAFERRRTGARRKPWGALLARSVAWCAAGVTAWLLLRQLHALLGERAWWWQAMAVVVAFSMTVHFGCIGVHAAVLRWLGYQTDPQFRAPWLAQNLREFWARRWNVAFSSLVQIAVHRPLARPCGVGVATAAGFVLSGLLHELACSVPVLAGLGWPTVYFLLHAVAVAIEDRCTRRGVRVGGRWGRLWTFAWLLLPVPLLFHPPFARQILLPLLQG